VAQVEVEEWFRNLGGGLGEGDYLYPLPGEAVFTNYSLFQGDQELRGETMDAGQARRIYEEIVRRKRDPALIELVGHGLIRARVFPINPGEVRKITLRYTQVLERSGDALQFRYSGGARAASVARGTPTARPEHEPASVTLTLVATDGERFGEPFSPTHEVRTRREGGQLQVQPVGDLRGDFSVILPLARAVVGVSLVTHRPAGEDGYFMLTLSPGRPDGRTLPRDVTVVLDVSGSMSGSKLMQAKAALRQLLNSLNGRDRFRLLAFSNSVQALTTDWAEYSPDDLAHAREWIDHLQADGGTNIAGALAEAFRLESPEERIPIVVFLTDGLPSVGERDPERIAERAEHDRGRVRVFAFGVGHDVNTYLLDRLSAAGRGSTEYVEPGEDVERALGLLAAKIQHPVLADLAIAEAPVGLTEIYPGTLPDLFEGDELVVFGRYRSRGGNRGSGGSIVITGQRAGRTERFTTDVSFPEHELANDYIPRLWASRKIGVLSQEIRLHGRNTELEREIRETALRYGLLSEYTSYLVQEPTAVADQIGRRQDMSAQAVMPAAAPEASSGVGAVGFSKRERARREARSMEELEGANEDVLMLRDMGQARHVAGRLFTEIDGVWTDLHHGDSTRTVSVRPFSEAYFAVLQVLPELREYASEFSQVLVTGERVSVRIADDGADRISDSDLARLVREFRAS